MRTKNDRAKKTIIKFRPSLFWDVDPKTIDPKKHTKYIIERVLDFGNDQEVKELWENFPRRRIYEAVSRSRGINPRTRALWTLLAGGKK